MSVPSRLHLIQDLTASSGKVRVFGTVLSYDVHTAIVTLEAAGHTVNVDVSILLVSRNEGESANFRVTIGQSVHVMGYVEQHIQERGIMIKATMYWDAGNLTSQDKAGYADVIAARTKRSLTS